MRDFITIEEIENVLRGLKYNAEARIKKIEIELRGNSDWPFSRLKVTVEPLEETK